MAVKKTIPVENLLGVRFPDLVKEWHPTKNGKLTAFNVSFGCNEKIWWICTHGHEWETRINHRSQGSGCPYCSGRKASPDRNFSVQFPDLTKEWHPTKNGELTAFNVLSGSHKKVWWLCKKGHEWETSIHHRANGTACPFCAGNKVSPESSLATKFPGIANEWNTNKNGKLTPFNFTSGSHKKVWWLCSNKHEWKATIKSRTEGNGCPYCGGKKATPEHNLAVKFPDLVKEWHPSKNGQIKPNDMMPKSCRKVWWKCDKEHEWEAKIYSRTNGNGCPFCSGRKATINRNLAVKFPNLIEEWHSTKNGKLTASDVTPSSGKKVWWFCNQGHEWKTSVRIRTDGKGCPHCYRNYLKGYNRLSYPSTTIPNHSKPIPVSSLASNPLPVESTEPLLSEQTEPKLIETQKELDAATAQIETLTKRLGELEQQQKEAEQDEAKYRNTLDKLGAKTDQIEELNEHLEKAENARQKAETKAAQYKLEAEAIRSKLKSGSDSRENRRLGGPPARPRSSLAGHQAQQPAGEDHLIAMRKAAWQKQGIIVLKPEDINDDWVRQAVINEAQRKFGPKSGS